MARKVKRRRRDTKRVRLGKALRSELAPLMASHGFRNAPELWNRRLGPTPADFWARSRGAYTDKVRIYWPYGAAPRFNLAADTDQPERHMMRPLSIHVRPWVMFGPFRGHSFEAASGLSKAPYGSRRCEWRI